MGRVEPLNVNVNIARIVFFYHIAIVLLAITACILYVTSTSIATDRDTAVPFHLDAKTNLNIERALLPGFVCLVYLFTLIPIPAPRTKGHLRTACEYFRFAQKHFKTGKYIRPLLLAYFAIHLAFKSFIVLQEIALYGFLGKMVSVISKFLPKAVCTAPDSLCDVYKGAAWTAFILSVLVIIDIVLVDKNREQLLEDEDNRDSRRNERATEVYEV
ncbi:hypothetical protein BGZ65_012433 [Modicella reniformis]|uniref:Uncharacterized protein n=1 Tax=Modicella reniformis TaxID=1440133 RepID=A0A9P6MJR1_9FUNG|nr:hypothetical protein BGZ65_012433 [Modicella reniformis]